MAADRMAADKAGGGGGGLHDLLGGFDLSSLGLDNMDLGALMKDLDPNTLQDLIMEGMKDPQIQQMVSTYATRHDIDATLLSATLISFFISLYSDQ